MRDFTMRSLVAFMEWASDSPIHTAIVCATVGVGLAAFLWALYDHALWRYRVWRFKHGR